MFLYEHQLTDSRHSGNWNHGGTGELLPVNFEGYSVRIKSDYEKGAHVLSVRLGIEMQEMLGPAFFTLGA